jgi:hypothetical protein
MPKGRSAPESAQRPGKATFFNMLTSQNKAGGVNPLQGAASQRAAALRGLAARGEPHVPHPTWTPDLGNVRSRGSAPRQDRAALRAEPLQAEEARPARAVGLARPGRGRQFAACIASRRSQAGGGPARGPGLRSTGHRGHSARRARRSWRSPSASRGRAGHVLFTEHDMDWSSRRRPDHGAPPGTRHRGRRSRRPSASTPRSAHLPRKTSEGFSGSRASQPATVSRACSTA